MVSLLALAWTLSVSGVEVSVAPDQPVPHVYVDEPLIIEFKSTTESNQTVICQAEFARDQQSPTVINLGEIPLRAHAVYWHAVEGLPTDHGRYTISFRVNSNGATTEHRQTFCRIDRPDGVSGVPLAVQVAALDAKALQALQGLPSHRVRLRGDAASIEEQLRQARGAGFHVIMALDTGHLENPATAAQSLVQRVGDGVSRWDLDPADSFDKLAVVVKAIRETGSRAPVNLVVGDSENLSSLLQKGAGQYIQGCVYQPEPAARDRLPTVRAAAERAGYEGLPISAIPTVPAAAAADLGRQVTKQILRDFAAGAVEILADMPLLFDAGEFKEGYVYCSALMHRLDRAVFMGEMEVTPPVTALVFRAGAKWIMALWIDEGAKEITLNLGKVTDLALTDALNNALPTPQRSQEAVTLVVTPEPLYLSGRGGSVPGQAACRRARREAQAFAENADYQKRLPPEMIDLVKKIVSGAPAKLDHLDFFALLRALPDLEGQWHAGRLPRGTAAPALASLARIARALCVCEEERAEPFIEPLKETLARCSEYQSKYVTSSGNSAGVHERGDWLLSEVHRLTAEAELVAENGMNIEAAAVAALAEWRARGLEFAAKAAPLSEPDKVALAETEAKETKEKSEKSPPKPAGKAAVSKKKKS
ncbi:MAG: hypothetical protein HY706_02215 [Candidatus Hydrogenedentes bacterium]|nr:hypothetical protein [Candidatus Hydrogenedentota bacterium]